MNFYLIGIDHKKTPIDIREAAYWGRPDIIRFLAVSGAGQTAVFSTCNRFEVYGIAENVVDAKHNIDLLQNRFNAIFNNAYIILDKTNVFDHLVRLATGLESQIRGETQIFAQLGTWAEQKSFPEALGRLVYDALLAAHGLRAKFSLNMPENNIAVLLYDRMLSQSDRDNLLNVVVAGTGKIAELFALYKPEGVRLYFAAHKNILKAQILATRANGKALLLKELPTLILNADVLISATSSPHRVFDKNYFLKIAAQRKRNLYIYDLAVPRDVTPDVKNIHGIVLKNIDEAILNVDFKNRLKTEPVSH